jgi:hypothetical protein
MASDYTSLTISAPQHPVVVAAGWVVVGWVGLVVVAVRWRKTFFWPLRPAGVPQLAS